MHNKQFIKLKPKRILVITLRFLGDTLLTTPLLNTLKLAYPEAALDVLTFKSNAAMLENNPCVDNVITLNSKPGIFPFIKLLLKLYRKYDLAISTQAGDRPVLCSAIAGKRSLGFVTPEAGKSWWKKWLLSESLVFSTDYDHAVLENLRFCVPLGIRPFYKVIPPVSQRPLPPIPEKPYAVLHIMPQWRYKEWHKDGWIKLIDYLSHCGLGVILTGSGQQNEQQALSEIQAKLSKSVVNLAGKLSLGQLTELIGAAAIFVGPDTGITHLAAATGTPTIALFGPTDPEKWAPWPTDYRSDTPPFKPKGTQHVGNVLLIQSSLGLDCIPCQLEGCDRHRGSHSACLEQLTAQTVIQLIAPIIDAITVSAAQKA